MDFIQTHSKLPIPNQPIVQCHRFQADWFGNGTDAYLPLSQQPRGPGTFLGVGPTWLPPCPHHHQHCHHSHDRHNEHQNTGVPETEGRVLENKSKSGKSWQKDSPHGMNNRRIQKDLRRNFRKIHLLEWPQSVFLEGFRRIFSSIRMLHWAKSGVLSYSFAPIKSVSIGGFKLKVQIWTCHDLTFEPQSY